MIDLLHPIARRARDARLNPPARGGWIELPRHADGTLSADPTRPEDGRVRTIADGRGRGLGAVAEAVGLDVVAGALIDAGKRRAAEDLLRDRIARRFELHVLEPPQYGELTDVGAEPFPPLFDRQTIETATVDELRDDPRGFRLRDHLLNHPDHGGLVETVSPIRDLVQWLADQPTAELIKLHHGDHTTGLDHGEAVR